MKRLLAFPGCAAVTWTAFWVLCTGCQGPPSGPESMGADKRRTATTGPSFGAPASQKSDANALPVIFLPCPKTAWPWVGVVSVSPDPETMAALGTGAVRLRRVFPDSPAGRGGLKSGDVITGMNGQRLEKLPTAFLTAANFIRMMYRTRMGESITLTLLRNGETTSVRLTVEGFPVYPDERARLYMRQLGLMVRNKAWEDEWFDPGPTCTMDGVYVTAVLPKGPAETAGLKDEFEYQLITAVEGKPVLHVGQVKEIVEASLRRDPNKPIEFTVYRGEKEEKVPIRPARSETRPAGGDANEP